MKMGTKRHGEKRLMSLLAVVCEPFIPHQRLVMAIRKRGVILHHKY
jgi:hypothetical protein